MTTHTRRAVRILCGLAFLATAAALSAAGNGGSTARAMDVASLADAIPSRAMLANMERERSWLADYLGPLQEDNAHQRHYMLQFIQHGSYEAAVVAGCRLLGNCDREMSLAAPVARTGAVSQFIDVVGLIVSALEGLREYDAARRLMERTRAYVASHYKTLPELELDGREILVREALYARDYVAAAQRCRAAAEESEQWRGGNADSHAYSVVRLWIDAGRCYRLAGRPTDAISACQEAQRAIAAHPRAARRLTQSGLMGPDAAEEYEQWGASTLSGWIDQCRQRLETPDSPEVLLSRHVDDAVERARLLFEMRHRVQAPSKALQELEVCRGWLDEHPSVVKRLSPQAQRRYETVRQRELPRLVFDVRNELCRQAIGRTRVFEWTARWDSARTMLDTLRRHTAMLLEDPLATDDQRISWEWNLYFDFPLRLARALNALGRKTDAAETLMAARSYWRARPDAVARRPRAVRKELIAFVEDGVVPVRYQSQDEHG